MTRWIKVPGPGQFRGEGEWVELDSLRFKSGEVLLSPEEAWEELQRLNYLPTYEQEEKPE